MLPIAKPAQVESLPIALSVPVGFTFIQPLLSAYLPVLVGTMQKGLQELVLSATQPVSFALALVLLPVPPAHLNIIVLEPTSVLLVTHL